MGNGGWGLWAVREEFDARRASQRSTVGSSEDVHRDEGNGGGGRSGLGAVKVFCWGEVVEHVFLLLYVASKSKIRKCGAEWRDGGEEVVIGM